MPTPKAPKVAAPAPEELIKEAVKQLETRVTQLGGELDTVRVENRRLSDRLSASHNENARLRDELHNMTIDKARLEGYIDRARQFDPPPEHVMVPQAREMLGRDFQSPVHSLRSYGSDGGNFPWYRRG